MEEKVKQISDIELASILAKNNQDEQMAIKGYFDLLNKISNSGIVGNAKYKDVVEAVKEIISDEMNHSEKLSALATKYSGVQAAKS